MILINFKIEEKIINIIFIQKKQNKDRFAFIEFDSHKTAKHIIKEYNNKIINGQLLTLNWARQNYNNNIKNNRNEIITNYYTVNYIFFYIIIVLHI